VIVPVLDDEHQRIVSRLCSILQNVVGWPGFGEVRPGVNLAASHDDWERDYRAPDVVVFLRDTQARNHDTHWCGPADFLVEITSPGDRTRDKLPFYSRLGVREVLIVDRDPWALELLRWQDGALVPAGRSTAAEGGKLASETVPLEFELAAGQARPAIRVVHPPGDRVWDV
jgi:Uma2 family endonuclease